MSKHTKAKKRTKAPVRRRKKNAHVRRRSTLRPKRKSKPLKPRSSPVRRKARDLGYGNKIRHTSLRHGGREVTVDRRGTRFAGKHKISRTSGANTALKEKLVRTALTHAAKIGRSKKNLTYVKLEYTYKDRNGKKQRSRFSIGTSKIRNAAQLTDYVESTFAAFEKKLNEYSARGFYQINLSGLSVTGYK